MNSSKKNQPNNNNNNNTNNNTSASGEDEEEKADTATIMPSSTNASTETSTRLTAEERTSMATLSVWNHLTNQILDGSQHPEPEKKKKNNNNNNSNNIEHHTEPKKSILPQNLQGLVPEPKALPSDGVSERDMQAMLEQAERHNQFLHQEDEDDHPKGDDVLHPPTTTLLETTSLRSTTSSRTKQERTSTQTLQVWNHLTNQILDGSERFSIRQSSQENSSRRTISSSSSPSQQQKQQQQREDEVENKSIVPPQYRKSKVIQLPTAGVNASAIHPILEHHHTQHDNVELDHNDDDDDDNEDHKEFGCMPPQNHRAVSNDTSCFTVPTSNRGNDTYDDREEMLADLKRRALAGGSYEDTTTTTTTGTSTTTNHKNNLKDEDDDSLKKPAEPEDVYRHVMIEHYQNATTDNNSNDHDEEMGTDFDGPGVAPTELQRQRPFLMDRPAGAYDHRPGVEAQRTQNLPKADIHNMLISQLTQLPPQDVNVDPFYPGYIPGEDSPRETDDCHDSAEKPENPLKLKNDDEECAPELAGPDPVIIKKEEEVVNMYLILGSVTCFVITVVFVVAVAMSTTGKKDGSGGGDDDDDGFRTIPPSLRPSDTPSMSPTFELPPILMDFPDDSIFPQLRQPNSPQYRAYTWLLDNPDFGTLSNETLQEKLALMILLFSLTPWDSPNPVDWFDAQDDVGSYQGTWECDWPIVTCSERSNATHWTVTRISLNSYQLKGRLPDQIGWFSNLRHLYLAENELFGSLPPALGNLTQLRHLELRVNPTLTGTLPTQLGQLTSLEDVQLNNNALSGSLPTELGSWTNLQSFRLALNALYGSLPSEFASFTQLTDLQLHRNFLTGTLPPEWGGGMTSLKSLILSDNAKLTGTIPPTFANMTELETISLIRTGMTGSIPAVFCKAPAFDYSCSDFDCGCKCGPC